MLPKVHGEPSAVCPVAQKPTITGIAASSYSYGATDDSDKFNILVGGTGFTPYTAQTITLSSTVAGMSSPVTQSFTFEVGNPACFGAYTTAEDSQLQADNPNPIYIINNPFNQDFVFPANSHADFITCRHSLKFKGADISGYPAISVTKRTSQGDFLVNLNMSG